jgi:hypothetical protein
MRMAVRIILSAIFIGLMIFTAAHATPLRLGAIAISEPQDIALLMFGMAGLWLGRRASRTRRRPREYED